MLWRIVFNIFVNKECNESLENSVVLTELLWIIIIVSILSLELSTNLSINYQPTIIPCTIAHPPHHSIVMALP